MFTRLRKIELYDLLDLSYGFKACADNDIFFSVKQIFGVTSSECDPKLHFLNDLKKPMIFFFSFLSIISNVFIL